MLIVGGGKDAIPVCLFAKQLGWQVSVWDPRAAYANKNDFTHADHIIRMPSEELAEYAQRYNVNFAVTMSHNVDIDAKALASLAYSELCHLALLGPKNRFNDVVKATGIPMQDFIPKLSGPAGLEIGGELPTSIALSIVAQFHALAHLPH